MLFRRRKKKAPPPGERRTDSLPAEPSEAADGGAPPPDLSQTLFLARGAKAGDSRAWRDLDARIRPWLERTLAFRKLPPSVEAEDVIQDVLLYVHQRFEQFEVEPDAEFRGWVLRILDHKLVDLWRRASAKKRGAGAERLLGELDGDDGGAGLPADGSDRPSVLLRAHEIQERLSEVKQQLSEAHRTVLELREEQELSFAAIAERMGYPNEAAVRALLRRARLRRRELMPEFDDGGDGE